MLRSYDTKLEMNVSKILDSLIASHDRRIRPNYGGKFPGTVFKQLPYPTNILSTIHSSTFAPPRIMLFVIVTPSGSFCC